MRRRLLLAISHTGSVDMSNYLTIEALADGLTASLPENDCEYSIDGGEWAALPAGTATPAINAGHVVSFRGTLTPATSVGIGTFRINKACNLSGNAMSMLFGDEAADATSLSGKNYAFYKLFNSCTAIREVADGFLPATTLSNYCYQYMFQSCYNMTKAPNLPAMKMYVHSYHSMFIGCKALTTAPDLPATELSTGCYRVMFQNCTSLTKAPDILPATTLKSQCYNSMFYGCTSLTKAPILPAITLTGYNYEAMFYNCKALTYVKALFTTTPSSSYTYQWLYGVASSGTFVKNKDATWETVGVNGVPSGWIVKTE